MKHPLSRCAASPSHPSVEGDGSLGAGRPFLAAPGCWGHAGIKGRELSPLSRCASSPSRPSVEGDGSLGAGRPPELVEGPACKKQGPCKQGFDRLSPSGIFRFSPEAGQRETALGHAGFKGRELSPLSRCTKLPLRSRAGGFTLVELLVALVAMALMALMGWRGLDSMLRSQQYTQAHSDAHAVLQTSLAQWSADLDGLMALEHTEAIAWDGQVLRMTRRFSTAPEQGALVVAWTRRTSQGHDQWLRWQSPPVRTRSEWSEAWSQAAQWARNPSASQRQRETTLLPLNGWSIYFYRDGAWSHPQSSDATNAPPASAAASGAAGTGTEASGAEAAAPPAPAAPSRAPRKSPDIPEGVRLVLDFPPGAGITGRISRDWVNPLRQNNRT